MSLKAEFRRPALGPRIADGLELVVRKTAANIDHGYYPATWTPRDRNNVTRALAYLQELVEWQRSKGHDKRSGNVAPPNRFVKGEGQ